MIFRIKKSENLIQDKKFAIKRGKYFKSEECEHGMKREKKIGRNSAFGYLLFLILFAF